MAESREVRDPIHGFVCLTSKEADVLGSQVVQRLRGISQLAFAHLVYPGAHHTRFEHSLGVCHIARLLGQRLRLSEEDQRLVRLAALLHDIGHGPFSHVSEHALENYADRSKVAYRLKGKEINIHELLTQDLILSDTEIRRSLGQDDCTRIAKLLSEGYDEPLLRSLVSGPLDADKQDYLLRDSHYCGVKYGIFDLEQMQRALIARDPGDGSMQLMIAEDGIHALEQFVLAKYYMTTQVYRHRIRLITDEMLVRAIKLGVEHDEIAELHSLYAYDGTDEFVKRYIQWDDSRFLFSFGGDTHSGKLIHQMLNRLTKRRLLKSIYHRKIKEFPEHCREPLEDITAKENEPKRTELESNIFEAIAHAFGQHLNQGKEASHSIILHSYKLKSVKEQSRDSEGPILVERVGKPKMFEEESLLFRSIDETLSEGHVEVYAPVIYDTPAQRRQIRMGLDQPITSILCQFPDERGDADENT